MAALSAGARTGYGQTEFPQTLNWGSGLIDIPAAWVSPVTGDFALDWAARSLRTTPAIPSYHRSLAGTAALQVALFGRAELGMSLLSSDFEHGLYGQALLFNEDDFRGRPAGLLPSVAVGMRNVGPYSHIDRLGLGYQQALGPGRASAPVIVPDASHRSFSTANTLYGVATKSFSLADLRPTWPDVGVSLTLGYGDGLFSNHGTLPTRTYAADATGGLFYGVKADVRPSPNTVVALMAENNAWDFNAGAYVGYRGLRAGLAMTELGAGSPRFAPSVPTSALYRYSKLDFTIGWQSNLFAIVHGDVLRNRVATLRRQQALLLAEIGQRQERIVELQGEIHRYEAQNLLELEERRAQAETQLRTETDALHRLEERLRRVEAETAGMAPADPSATPRPTPAAPPAPPTPSPASPPAGRTP